MSAESSTIAKQLENLTIGAFTEAVGANIETIRFRQRTGLLLGPDKPHGSIRRYTASDIGRLRFIKSAQQLDFSRDEVGESLRLEDGTHCVQSRSIRE